MIMMTYFIRLQVETRFVLWNFSHRCICRETINLWRYFVNENICHVYLIRWWRHNFFQIGWWRHYISNNDVIIYLQLWWWHHYILENDDVIIFFQITWSNNQIEQWRRPSYSNHCVIKFWLKSIWKLFSRKKLNNQSRAKNSIDNTSLSY